MPRATISHKNLIQPKDSVMKLHFYFMLLMGVLICSPEAANAQDSNNTLVATAAAAPTIDTSLHHFYRSSAGFVRRRVLQHLV